MESGLMRGRKGAGLRAIVPLLLGLWPFASLACICPDRDLEAEIEEADVVVVANIGSMLNSSGDTRYRRVVVATVFRGHALTSELVATDSGGCGYLQDGADYLIVANRTMWGALETSRCSGTRLYGPDVAQRLGQGRQPVQISVALSWLFASVLLVAFGIYWLWRLVRRRHIR